MWNRSKLYCGHSAKSDDNLFIELCGFIYMDECKAKYYISKDSLTGTKTKLKE